DYNVYAFILSSKTPSIFKNESDEEPVKEDKSDDKKSDEKEESKKKDDKKQIAKSDSTKTTNIAVDFDNISNRILALPLAARYYRLDGSVRDLLVYQRGRTIGVYDLNKLEDRTLIENAIGS